MRAVTDIIALADRLVAEATTVKTAAAQSAPETAEQAHPLVMALKQAAAALRDRPDMLEDDLQAVEKVAAALQPVTGAQAPATGTTAQKPSLLRSIVNNVTDAASTAAGGAVLRPSNLGVVAGTGGAPATPKPSLFRTIANKVTDAASTAAGGAVLRPSNLGVVAGTGGAPATSKLAQELRKVAEALRADTEKTAQDRATHVLNASCALHYLRKGFTP